MQQAEITAKKRIVDALKRMGGTYARFFLNTYKERHVFLQGGRRSRKTWSTFDWLTARLAPGQVVMVVCFSTDQLQKTIDDFTACTGVPTYGTKIHSHMAKVNGVVFYFDHFDEATKAQGTQCDVLFLNEAVNIDEKVANVLFMGVRKQIVYNYNPTGEFWGTYYIKPDRSNLLCTTFRDNPFLTAAQLEEFETIRQKGTSPSASPFDVYNYEVYYLGNFSKLSGSVFGNVYTCTDEEYKAVPCSESFGMDFGFAQYGDPTTLVGVKIFGERLFIRQYIYERGINSQQIADRLHECGITRMMTIAGDYGGFGRMTMDELIRLGFSFCNAVKSSIKGGIERMNNYTITITENSIDARKEFAGLEYTEGVLKARNGDHAVDAARYATLDWLARWG